MLVIQDNDYIRTVIGDDTAVNSEVKGFLLLESAFYASGPAGKGQYTHIKDPYGSSVRIHDSYLPHLIEALTTHCSALDIANLGRQAAVEKMAEAASVKMSDAS